MRISDWSSDVCSSDLEALRDAFGQDHGVDRPLGHGGDLMPVVEGIRRIDGDCIGVGSAITAGRVLEQFTHGGPMPPERVDLEAPAPSPAAGFATVTTFAFDEQPTTAMPQQMPSRSEEHT